MKKVTVRGYSAIGLYKIKNHHNYGGVIRAAHCYGAAMIAIAGARYDANRVVKNSENTTRGEKHIPVLHGENLQSMIPFDCVPIAVDLVEDAIELQNFQHPLRGFYIFGPEDGTLGKNVLPWCKHRLVIPTQYCMNLAATVNVVLYDRLAKQLLDAKRQARRADTSIMEDHHVFA
jgi:tRNA(Leu) C34 or U34 (ribose-2'-O)-methylase TrmL